MAYEDSYNIYVMNADGSGATQITFSGTDRQPDWSPDGKKIVFMSSRDYAPGYDSYYSEIYVMNADGSTQTRLTFECAQYGAGCSPGTINQAPHWSADNTQIVFSAQGPPAWGYPPSGLFSMNPDGTKITQVLNVDTVGGTSLPSSLACQHCRRFNILQ
jgi:Tol biopolymer transport system component